MCTMYLGRAAYRAVWIEREGEEEGQGQRVESVSSTGGESRSHIARVLDDRGGVQRGRPQWRTDPSQDRLD